MLITRYLRHSAVGYKALTSNVVPLSSLEFSPHTSIQKTPMLIFHGLFGSKHNWKTASEKLAKRTQRKVYAFDLRNHGESPSVDGAISSLDAMAGDVMQFVERQNLEKVVLLGHSLGGRIISQFAFNWPEKVEQLIVVDALPVNSETLEGVPFLYAGFFDLLIRSIQQLPLQTKVGQARKEIGAKLFDYLKNEHFVRFLIMSLRKENGKFKWRFDAINLDRMVQSGFINQINLRQPFLGRSMLIYGEHSEFVRRCDYGIIHSAIPNVKIVEIKGTGHYLHIEKPEQFADCVVDFLESYN